jgi:hypothetical protein
MGSIFVFLTTKEYRSALRHQIMTNGNPADLVRKEADLIAAIDKNLPDFARACRAHDIPIVVMHQDAFAADYQEDEYRLIGMAISSLVFAAKKSEFTEKIGRP